MPEINLSPEKKELLRSDIESCIEYFKDQYCTMLSMIKSNRSRYINLKKISKLANSGGDFFDVNIGDLDIPLYTELNDRVFGTSYYAMDKLCEQHMDFLKRDIFDFYNATLKKIVGNFFFNNYSHHIPMKLVKYLDTDKIYDSVDTVFDNLQTWWDDFIKYTDKPNYDIEKYANYINRVFSKKEKQSYLDDTSMTFHHFIKTEQFKGLKASGKFAIKLPKADIWWMSDYPLFERIDALLSWMERTYHVSVKNSSYKVDKLIVGNNIYDNAVIQSINIYKNNSVVIKFKDQSIRNTWNQRIKKLISND